MENNKLPKQERLSGRKRIGTLFDEGNGGFVYPFKYIFKVTDPDVTGSCVSGDPIMPGGHRSGGVSILVSVPKKNHKRAVRRNKIRRRTREAFRLANNALSGVAVSNGRQVDLALIYVSKEIEEYKTIEHAVGKILAQIAENI